MRAITTLRLRENDVELFHEALRFYGYQTGASFLRVCAYLLIESRRQNLRLINPLSFRTKTPKKS
jgi:hypothetical protein